MNPGQGGPWKGKGESKGPDKSLEKALAAAWEDAKSKGAPAGTYVVDSIKIDTENPIRGYIVTITDGG